MILVRHVADDGFVIIIDSPYSIEIFKELVHRATNLWPDAAPEIKIFADEITNFEWHVGPLQDYASQDTSPVKPDRFKGFTGYKAEPCEKCGKRFSEHLGKMLRCPSK